VQQLNDAMARRIAQLEQQVAQQQQQQIAELKQRQMPSLVSCILPPFRKKRRAVLSLSRCFQTSPKRHPLVIVRPPRSQCDVTLGTILMIDFRQGLRRYSGSCLISLCVLLCAAANVGIRMLAK